MSQEAVVWLEAGKVGMATQNHENPGQSAREEVTGAKAQPRALLWVGPHQGPSGLRDTSQRPKAVILALHVEKGQSEGCLWNRGTERWCVWGGRGRGRGTEMTSDIRLTTDDAKVPFTSWGPTDGTGWGMVRSEELHADLSILSFHGDMQVEKSGRLSDM